MDRTQTETFLPRILVDDVIDRCVVITALRLYAEQTAELFGDDLPGYNFMRDQGIRAAEMADALSGDVPPMKWQSV